MTNFILPLWVLNLLLISPRIKWTSWWHARIDIQSLLGRVSGNTTVSACVLPHWHVHKILKEKLILFIYWLNIFASFIKFLITLNHLSWLNWLVSYMLLTDYRIGHYKEERIEEQKNYRNFPHLLRAPIFSCIRMDFDVALYHLYWLTQYQL